MTEKIKVHIDPRGYNEKPSNKEIGGIKARLQKNASPSLVTLEELVQKIETGHSISSGIMEGMSAKNNNCFWSILIMRRMGRYSVSKTQEPFAATTVCPLLSTIRHSAIQKNIPNSALPLSWTNPSPMKVCGSISWKRWSICFPRVTKAA